MNDLKRLTRLFSVLLLMVAMLLVTVALPAFADHDNGNGTGHSGCHEVDCPTATTATTGSPATTAPTTSAPVTTAPVTTAPVTTAPLTTTPPASTPATTTPGGNRSTTTTSTIPLTTTTTVTNEAIPLDPKWNEQRLETADPSTSRRDIGAPEAFESKETMVLSMGGSAVEDDGQSGTGDNGSHISPRENLTVAFRSAVETIHSQLIFATALGILIAGLSIVGVGKLN